MEHVQKNSRWELLGALFILMLLVWRITFLYFAPIELSPDEAYYWDWSRRLDWGYYSKPPMVAWIIAGGTHLLGNSAFAVRLPAAIFATLSILFCLLVGRAMFNPKTGIFAALLAAASPGACVAGFVMTIDAPLLCFWAMALFSAWNAVQAELQHRKTATSLAWWLITGTAAGAGFLSKQTMFAFWPVFLTFIMAGKDTRHLIKSWRLHLAVLVSILALAPVIWWNMQHQWITLTHTAHHFEQSDRSLLESLKTFSEFAGSQLAVISPVTCFLVFLTGITGLLMYKTFIFRNTPIDKTSKKITLPILHRQASGMLLLSGIAILLPITGLSLKQRVNANWPAPFYIAPLIFTAAWYCGVLDLGKKINRMRNLVKPALITGGIMAMILYSLPVLIPATPLEGTKLDPFTRVTGWKDLASKVEAIKNTLPRPDKTFIITRRRQTASELAFYMPGNPVTYRWSGNRNRISTQYELWPGPDKLSGWEALIIVDQDKELPADLPRHFHQFRKIDSVSIIKGKHRIRAYNIYYGSQFKPRPN